MTSPIRHFAVKALRSALATALGLSLSAAMIASATSLADKPVMSPDSEPTGARQRLLMLEEQHRAQQITLAKLRAASARASR